MLVGQPEVRARLVVEGSVALAAVGARLEDRQLTQTVELAVGNVRAADQVSRAPEQVRGERANVVEHGELGDNREEGLPIALSERAHGLPAYAEWRIDSIASRLEAVPTYFMAADAAEPNRPRGES
jgi:hypothetical protein